MKHQTSVAATFEHTVPSGISKTWQLVGALILGSVIIYGAGFANAAVLHNAAHDTRHSQGFPCH